VRHDLPKCGLWGTICCEIDAHQLTVEHLEVIIESLIVDGFNPYEGAFFDTKAELIEWCVRGFVTMEIDD